jgi:hypothetical protein
MTYIYIYVSIGALTSPDSCVPTLLNNYTTLRQRRQLRYCPRRSAAEAATVVEGYLVRRVISVALQRAIAHQLRTHHLRRIGVISKGDAVAAEICPGLNDANHRSCHGG